MQRERMAAFGRLCAFFGEIPAFGRGEILLRKVKSPFGRWNPTFGGVVVALLWQRLDSLFFWGCLGFGLVLWFLFGAFFVCEIPALPGWNLASQGEISLREVKSRLWRGCGCVALATLDSVFCGWLGFLFCVMVFVWSFWGLWDPGFGGVKFLVLFVVRNFKFFYFLSGLFSYLML